jgi:hypothetical protein
MVATAESRFISVETRAEMYRRQFTAEIKDAAAPPTDASSAVLCFDLADSVSQGVDLFRSINQLDEDWRLMVFGEALPYDAAFENRIGKLYRFWLDTTQAVLAAYERLATTYAARGFDMRPVEALYSAVREVAGLLTDDARFFAHDQLVDLRDAAIDAHQAGHSVEMHDLGQ